MKLFTLHISERQEELLYFMIQVVEIHTMGLNTGYQFY